MTIQLTKKNSVALLAGAEEGIVRIRGRTWSRKILERNVIEFALTGLNRIVSVLLRIQAKQPLQPLMGRLITRLG
jgi:hypothetical protein